MLCCFSELVERFFESRFGGKKKNELWLERECGMTNLNKSMGW